MFAIRLINSIPVPGGENNGNCCLMALGGNSVEESINRIMEKVDGCAERWGGKKNVLMDIPRFPDECSTRGNDFIPALLRRLKGSGYKTERNPIPPPSLQELAVIDTDGSFPG